MDYDLEKALNLAQSDDLAKDLKEFQGMAKAIITKGRDTARSFRQAADTLDKLWKAANEGHAAGTSVSIVGGLLTIGGGVATLLSAGAATPLLLLGMGAGFAGAGVNVVASYIEASINSEEIKKAEKDWKETLDCINNAKIIVQQRLESKESTRLLFRLLAERHSGLELNSFARRLIPVLETGCTVLQQSVGRSGVRAATKAGTQAADDVAQVVAKAGAQAADDVAQAAAKVATQAADDVAQAAAKVATQAADDVTQAAAKAASQAADDVAQAGAKAGANAGKLAGKVIIGVSAVFLVWDLYDLHFTVRSLLNKKGSETAKVLRAKADELDKLCSSVEL